MDIAKLKKLKPQPYRKNLRAVVVAISDKITYSNRAGIEKNMWIIALCDQTSTIKCTVYSHEMVRKMEAGMEEGSCILISNYILKDRNRELQLVLTDNTKVYQSYPMEIDEATKQSAKAFWRPIVRHSVRYQQ